jgi:ornithine carbamoyltransferase
MKHLLSIEELSQEQIEKIVDLACVLKKDRKSSPQVLTGQQWAHPREL